MCVPACPALSQIWFCSYLTTGPVQLPGPALYTSARGGWIAELSLKLGRFMLKKGGFFVGDKRNVENILFSPACAIYLHTYFRVKALFVKYYKKKLFNLNKRLTRTFMFLFRVSLKGNLYLAAHYLLLRDCRL